MPVSSAFRPITNCRYNGITKNTPIRIRFWLNRPINPERSGGIFNRSRCTSGSVPMASRWCCQRKNPHNATPPAVITKIVSENPKISTGESFGRSQPQELDCRTPRTTKPSPLAAKKLPKKSSRGTVPVRGVSVIRRLMARMTSTRITSPTKTTRHESSVVAQPPNMGPKAIPAPATPPITA